MVKMFVLARWLTCISCEGKDTLRAMAKSQFRPRAWQDDVGELLSAVATAPEMAARGVSTGVRGLPLPGHERFAEQRHRTGPNVFAIIGIGEEDDEDTRLASSEVIAALVPKATCTVAVVTT
jgi:hypothetical protein